MKRIILATLCFLMGNASIVCAQLGSSPSGETRKLVNPLVERSYIKAGIAMNAGALNISAEYESLVNYKGWSAYGLLATEKKGVQNQAFVFGAGWPIYVLQGNRGQVSLTPGAGLMMVSNSGQSETGFGLHLKISAMQQVGSLRLGAEHFLVSNWINDKLPSGLSWTLLSFAFSL